MTTYVRISKNVRFSRQLCCLLNDFSQCSENTNGSKVQFGGEVMFAMSLRDCLAIANLQLISLLLGFNVLVILLSF